MSESSLYSLIYCFIGETMRSEMIIYIFIWCIILHHGIIGLPLSSEDTQRHQQRLSALIHDTLHSHNYNRYPSAMNHSLSYSDTKYYLLPLPESKSSIFHMCDRLQQQAHNHANIFLPNAKNRPNHMDDMHRFSCCAPIDLRHMYNVQILDNKVIFFNGKDAKRDIVLPKIKSMKFQRAHFFHMEVEERQKNFDLKDCKEYFNGTLHVIGRGTVKNVYHSIADNFIPIVTQILEDYIIDPELLYLPRLQLVGFHPSDADSVPHVRMIDKLMSAGEIHTRDVSGMCFRRIVWGHGPHIMYHDVNVHMRRVTSDFTRKFVTTFYNIPEPEPFKQVHQRHKKPHVVISKEVARSNEDDEEPPPESHYYKSDYDARRAMETKSDERFLIDGHPLRLTLYTRGDSGRGRSMQGENKLIDALNSLGISAVMCCDFSSSTMEDQIGYAYYADAVIGLHGAALAHSIFSHRGIVTLELKTLYGYTSTLFGLISDARMGTHSQVDVRDYFIVGGHKPVDESLIARVKTVLAEAIKFRKEQQKVIESSHGERSIDDIRVLDKPGDFVMNYAKDIDALRHILGPKASQVKELCARMIYTKIRKQLSADDENHCANCEESNG